MQKFICLTNNVWSFCQSLSDFIQCYSVFVARKMINKNILGSCVFNKWQVISFIKPVSGKQLFAWRERFRRYKYVFLLICSSPGIMISRNDFCFSSWKNFGWMILPSEDPALDQAKSPEPIGRSENLEEQDKRLRV